MLSKYFQISYFFFLFPTYPARRGILGNEETVLVDKIEKMMKEETNKVIIRENVE